MAFLDRFRRQPEWKSPDASVRLGAVRRMATDEQDLLISIARTDDDPSVRRAALKKLRDPAVVADVLRRDEDPSVKEDAADALVELANRTDDPAAAGVAL